ncbi:MAG TPA: RNA pseudouridine synthase, partial [Ruminococcus sp.]|nr:RNA pseudouridine synthase [Ruminococcus sp.]
MLNETEIIERLTLYADENAKGIRIEKWIADFGNTGFTRSRIDNLVRGGYVFLNGKQIIKTCKLKDGDIIEINVPAPLDLTVKPENIPLDIVYEDDDLLV